VNDEQLDRYARHIILKEIGGAGQQRLLDAHVVLVGAGGIGAPAIQYLAAAGVGQAVAASVNAHGPAVDAGEQAPVSGWWAFMA